VRAREARAAGALVDAVAAPEPPLPAVADTDAVASFATWLAYAPQPNRALLRAALLGLVAARIAQRDRAGRLALLRRLGHSPLAEGLRAIAAVSYYGDPGVLHALGHVAPPRYTAGRGAAPSEAARGAALRRPARGASATMREVRA
jgi:hypothetical protein